jgi:phytoene dehydrogenase-like protein
VTAPVVVAGAGMGGLSAALRLARRGIPVRVLEARDAVGGLASDLDAGGVRFDGGPYILLDRPGLEWAFSALGLSLEAEVALRRIEDVYEVGYPDGPRVQFRADLEETAAGIDRVWPGSGQRYAELVRWLAEVYARLRPLLFVSAPGAQDVLRSGAWREVPFLLRSLRSVLQGARLPRPLAEAVTVWTHIAGQRVDQAPSFMAFVPALIHGAGAFHPRSGIGSIPEALGRALGEAGVAVDTGVTVRAIVARGGRVVGLETDSGFVAARAVVSNLGLATYLDLLRPSPPEARARLRRLPLQSPGVGAYLRVRGPRRPPYLRFRLDASGNCRLFVATGVLDPGHEPWPARLLAPMDHGEMEAAGADGQRARLDLLLAESWWRESLDDVEVLATRIPSAWGGEFHLHRDAMNPVMTARAARTGRLAHRSPYVRGLYLAGSSTHPGQWVSFCAISGILAADRLLEDLGCS